MIVFPISMVINRTLTQLRIGSVIVAAIEGSTTLDLCALRVIPEELTVDIAEV